MSTTPLGLLLGTDLFFNSKITGTAAALGAKVVVATTLRAAMSQPQPPTLVFVDLTVADFASADALAALRATFPDAYLVAFGPHVDEDKLSAARLAGCQLVLPKSKLTSGLADILREHLVGSRS